MRVFLIGFMCSGKSRIGKDVAALLGMPFVDIDRVIEQRIGPITPFFRKMGEEAFRSVESEVLDELLIGPDAVIATGGGTPCFSDNLERMRKTGLVVHLQVPMGILLPRIERSGGDRPLLFGLSGTMLHERINELLGERALFYAAAHRTVLNDDTPEIVAERVADLVRTAQDR